MLRFRAAFFTNAMLEMGKAEAMLAMVRDDEPGAIQGLRDAVAGLIRAVNGPEDEAGLPVSRSLAHQIERFHKRVNDPQAIRQWDVITALSVEIQNNLIMEMTEPLFLLVPLERRALYEQRTPSFGDAVASKFPDAKDDIASGARCVALDEWTAAVFHSMRVLEHGLRALAAMVGVPFGANVDHENWRNIIDQIEKAIRDQEAERRSPEKVERLRVYSEAASQFRYFKDAWRNHVSHSRAHYHEHEALSVWNHVREFMQHMATV